jgi:hypothetical protein
MALFEFRVCRKLHLTDQNRLGTIGEPNRVAFFISFASELIHFYEPQ